jgi:D-alanyl-lipoteichoic acid acyltransferase DltB (MBOAT superfamily)
LAYVLFFLPVVVIGAILLRDMHSARAAQVWILAASLLSYGWGRPLDAALLIASITFNWAVSRQIVAAPPTTTSRRRWLQVGLLGNVGALCVFKYATFLLPQAARIQSIVALERSIPLGISFYTLMQVMYLVDCYEELIPASSLFQHATFVSFFAHVTAGPIDRTKAFVRQLPEIAAQESRWENIGRGLLLFAIGLLKKIAIADSFARVADAGYTQLSSLSTLEAWITTVSYSLQLYFDFSGYTDMALGSALLLGLTLTKNFDAPYRAKSVVEFWRRWHISLSMFITTYLYTPIIRSLGRVTIHKAAIATLTAMAIAGLWHGATWGFVLFGVMHGVALVVNQYWKKVKRPLPGSLAWILTFIFINLAFVAFRSPTLGDAMIAYQHLLPRAHMFSRAALASSLAGADSSLVYLWIVVGVVTAFIGPTSDAVTARLQWSRWMALGTSALLLIGLLYLNSNPAREFVYFRF